MPAGIEKYTTNAVADRTFAGQGGKSYHSAIQPFNFFKFSKYHKISRVSNSGLKIGNLSNFIMLFSFLANIFYYHLFYD